MHGISLSSTLFLYASGFVFLSLYGTHTGTEGDGRRGEFVRSFDLIASPIGMLMMTCMSTSALSIHNVTCAYLDKH